MNQPGEQMLLASTFKRTSTMKRYRDKRSLQGHMYGSLTLRCQLASQRRSIGHGRALIKCCHLRGLFISLLQLLLLADLKSNIFISTD